MVFWRWNFSNADEFVVQFIGNFVAEEIARKFYTKGTQKIAWLKIVVIQS